MKRLYLFAILSLEFSLYAACSASKHGTNIPDSGPVVVVSGTGGASGDDGPIVVGSGGSGVHDSGTLDYQSSADTGWGATDVAMDESGGCLVNGVAFQVGEIVITSTKPCVASCICLEGGVLGHCTGGCLEEAGAPQCGPVGATMPGSCGGTCNCLVGGIIGNCTVSCKYDAGITVGQ